MILATILAALLPLLEAAPEIVSDVEAFIAAFKSGGAPAAKALLASKDASDTSALETALQTPIR